MNGELIFLLHLYYDNNTMPATMATKGHKGSPLITIKSNSLKLL